MALEERIFHIDDECYLFYLGSDRDDDRPFARIGNSIKLTGNVISNISSIIITDSITGDPLLEPVNINPDNINALRYVGDKKTVSAIKKRSRTTSTLYITTTSGTDI